MKKAFTILEILLVIVMMGILLSISSRFGYQYIQSTQLKLQTQDFISFFNTVVFDNLKSNYYLNKPYDRIDFFVDSSGANVTYFYQDGTTGLKKIIMNNLVIVHTGFQKFAFSLQPYQFACLFIDNGNLNDNPYTGTVSFMIKNSFSASCFDFLTSPCKIYEKKCL